MIDIVSAHDGQDIGLFNTDVERAKNILSVQVGALTYADDFGIDLKYFLSEDFAFQNSSFQAYLVDRLANYGVNVTSVAAVIENLFTSLTFNIGNNEAEGDSLIAR